MVKPGFQWDPSKVASGATTVTPPTPVGNTNSEELKPITLLPEPTRPTRGHGRIPSVVLSPSPSLSALPDEKVVDIPLVLDTSNIPSSPTGGPETTYHTTISQPEFWEHLYTFLRYVILYSQLLMNSWADPSSWFPGSFPFPSALFFVIVINAFLLYFILDLGSLPHSTLLIRA